MKYGMYGDWDKLERDLKKVGGDLLEKNMNRAMKYIGIFLSGKMKLRIKFSTGMIALKDATVKRKRSSKPLIDYGDLMASFTYKMLGKTIVFIGVLRTARSKKRPGKNVKLFLVMQAHEFGAPKAGIPARAVVRPVLQRYKKFIFSILKRALRDTIRGRVFTPKMGGARV
jgi:hypothetical protein